MDKTLFNYCRYYKGEQSCPFAPNDYRSRLWIYEREWCEIQQRKDAKMNDILREYNVSGLDAFEPYDGTPVSLKAYLYECFANEAGVHIPDDFKKWYSDMYKKAGR